MARVLFPGQRECLEVRRCYNEGSVYGNARVCGDAEVFERGRLYENAEAYDEAKLFGNADVSCATPLGLFNTYIASKREKEEINISPRGDQKLEEDKECGVSGGKAWTLTTKGEFHCDACDDGFEKISVPGVDEPKCYPVCDNATEVLALKEGTDKNNEDNYVCVKDCTCGTITNSDEMKLALADGTVAKCPHHATSDTAVKEMDLEKAVVRGKNWSKECKTDSFITGILSTHESWLGVNHCDHDGSHRHDDTYKYHHLNRFSIQCNHSAFVTADSREWDSNEGSSQRDIGMHNGELDGRKFAYFRNGWRKSGSGARAWHESQTGKPAQFRIFKQDGTLVRHEYAGEQSKATTFEGLLE